MTQLGEKYSNRKRTGYFENVSEQWSMGEDNFLPKGRLWSEKILDFNLGVHQQSQLETTHFSSTYHSLHFFYAICKFCDILNMQSPPCGIWSLTSHIIL